MSFWVRAETAVNKVVTGHRHNIVGARLLLMINEWNRISRKIPATTMVLEWGRNETRLGPSMAEGSHGWRPHCAGFPVAAIRSPRRGTMFWLFVLKIYWNSHELVLRHNRAILTINPMSPMRLYKIACKATVLASDHLPVIRKHIITTPAQLINNWNILLAEVIIIVIENK